MTLPPTPPPAGQPYPPPQPPSGGWQSPPGYQPHYPSPYQPAVYQHATTASSGLPAWMHVLYAVGGVLTCGLLWIVWGVHWWFAQSKTRTHSSGTY